MFRRRNNNIAARRVSYSSCVLDEYDGFLFPGRAKLPATAAYFNRTGPVLSATDGIRRDGGFFRF